MNFYESWQYLYHHKMYKDKYGNSKFLECTEIEVVKVNPENNTVEYDERLNTKTEVWLETGNWCDIRDCPYHDMELDCGGDTYEGVIIKLAILVNNKGNLI